MTTFTDADRRESVDALVAEAMSLRWLDYDRVGKLAQEAFELSFTEDDEGHQYTSGMACALSLLADRSCTVGQWDTALSEANQAFALLAPEPENAVLGWVYISIGWTHYFLGDFVKAFDNLMKALQVAQETGDRSLEAYALERIAGVQGATDRLTVSVETHERALAILRELGDRPGEALVLNNMAYALIGLGELDTALRMATLSLAESERLGGEYLLLGVLDTLAEVELRLGHFDEAEDFSRRGLDLATACDSGPDIADAMFGLGRVESARGNWPAAIEATEAALAVAERLGRAVEEYLCHQLLSQINERAGNFEPALWHFQRFYELESATRSSENGSRLARLEVEHQIQAARKDAEIMRLRSIALEREVEDRRVTLAALEAQASLDALTGLFNRWHVDVLMNEVNKAITSGIEVSLIVFDVDEFKEVNDQFGHAAGDRVLTAVSAELRKNARRSDIPCRWGGDEFIMLLVDMDRVSAGQVAERLCAAVADTPVASEGALIPFTLSAGVASADPDGPTDFDSLLKDADIALYTAKEEGRNRVVVRDA